MKISGKIKLTAYAIYLTLFLAPTFIRAADAASIVMSVLQKISPGQWQGDYSFTNYRTDGTQHSYRLSVKARDSRTVFVLFLEPAREAGRQLLNRNGEIWSYLPDSRKIVRLADRDSIGNGDFNNSDVLRMNWLDDYNLEIVKESPKQYVIDMKAKAGGRATYHKVRLWVSKNGQQPIQQYFYDESGHHLKSLKYRDERNFHGIVRPSQLVMENVITGQRTLLKVKDFSKTSGITESRFRQENLGK